MMTHTAGSHAKAQHKPAARRGRPPLSDAQSGRTARVFDADLTYIQQQSEKAEPRRTVPQQIEQMTAVYKLVVEHFGTDSTTLLRRLIASGKTLTDALPASSPKSVQT